MSKCQLATESPRCQASLALGPQGPANLGKHAHLANLQEASKSAWGLAPPDQPGDTAFTVTDQYTLFPPRYTLELWASCVHTSPGGTYP